MLIVTSKYVRPSADVPFLVDPVWQAYREETFVQPGLVKMDSDTMSSDGLTRTTVQSWKTRADFVAFKQDPQTIAWQDARRKYCTANQILQTHEFEFVVSEGDPAPAV